VALEPTAYLRELMDLHREEHLAAHKRIRAAVIELGDAWQQAEADIVKRVTEMERHMDRVMVERRQSQAMSTRRAVILASLICSGIAGAVALITHFF